MDIRVPVDPGNQILTRAARRSPERSLAPLYGEPFARRLIRERTRYVLDDRIRRRACDRGATGLATIQQHAVETCPRPLFPIVVAVADPACRQRRDGQ